MQVEDLQTYNHLYLLAHTSIPTCCACGDLSPTVVCRACAETGEYCSCGAVATILVQVGAYRQPMCTACGDALLLAPRMRRAA